MNLFILQVLTTDKRKNQKSKMDISGYSIEIGVTPYGSTLEERIQAATVASIKTKIIQKRHNKGKLHTINYSNIASEKGTTTNGMYFEYKYSFLLL